MKTLDRYVVNELAPNFLFGVAAFSVLLIAGNVLWHFVKMITEQHVPLGLALEAAALQLPALLLLTFPMAMLLATLLGLGRMSGDLEITALRASGASFMRIITAGLVFSLCISLLTLFFSEVVVPKSVMKTAYLKAYMVQQGLDVGRLKSTMYQKREDGRLVQAIIADSYDPKSKVMQKVTVIQYGTNGAPVAVLSAQRAEWKKDDWFLYGCTLTELPGTKSKRREPVTARTDLLTQQLQVKPEDLLRSAKDPSEMSIAELKQRLRALAQAASKVARLDPQVAILETQFYSRTAVPFACFIFTLIGAPLGVRRQRTGASLGLGLSVLIIFGYYLLMHFSQTLGEGGVLPPLLGGWLANIVFGAAGAAMCYKANN